MFMLSSRLAVAGVILLSGCFSAAAANATSIITFVSDRGTDSGNCEEIHPCRSFQFAADQTSPFGEVKALDPANYGAVTITKSISITGVEGASISPSAKPNAITIDAGPNDQINLTNLTLDGMSGKAQRGIFINSSSRLRVIHCVVRNFKFDGIKFQNGITARFLIADTVVSDNLTGINAEGTGTLDNVSMNKNSGVGLVVDGNVTSVESEANGNGSDGFFIIDGSLKLVHSTATGNGCGINIFGGKTLSVGNNFINGNSITDVCPLGTKLSEVETQ